MEKNNISFEKQLKCYENFNEKLVNIEDITAFNKIYNKNVNLKYFVEMYQKKNKEILNYYMWLPISTANTERSFSVYKNILTYKRENLKSPTIFMIYLLLDE